MKKVYGEIVVMLQLCDLGEDVKATIEYIYIPGRVYGDPLEPDDPEEIDIKSIYIDSWDIGVPVSSLSEAAYEYICDQIHEYEIG